VKIVPITFSQSWHSETRHSLHDDFDDQSDVLLDMIDKLSEGQTCISSVPDHNSAKNWFRELKKNQRVEEMLGFVNFFSEFFI
jgi:hypothetical protein